MVVGYNEETDKRLDDIEAMLLTLAGTHKIVGYTITRWRWDEPGISQRWEDGGIGKNVLVTVEDVDNMSISYSAWKDDMSQSLRAYNTLSMGLILPSAIQSSIESAIVTIKRWGEDSLIKGVITRNPEVVSEV